jgi:hypothetical protein
LDQSLSLGGTAAADAAEEEEAGPSEWVFLYDRGMGLGELAETRRGLPD